MKFKVVQQFVKFGFVGCIATLIHYSIYLILKIQLGVNFSYTIGYGISLIFNFILSNYFTFKTKPTKDKGIKFGLAHGINYALQIILLNIYIKVGIEEQIAPILVYLICVPVNFLLVKKALNIN